MAESSPMDPAETIYCTITSYGYLPRALALARSIAAHEPARRVVVLVFDVVDPAGLPVIGGIEFKAWDFLGLTLREYLQMATYYQAYELATAIKPLFVLRLLEQCGGVVFLDSDTEIFSPLEEIEPLLQSSPVVLTPHIVTPAPWPLAEPIEHLLLRFGVYNMGFGAFNRDAVPFLEWWWARTRCDGFARWEWGFWCDQKWIDLGATIFEHHDLRHIGYNLAWWNVPARPLRLKDDGSVEVGAKPEPLRMVHFSNYAASDPTSMALGSKKWELLPETTQAALRHLHSAYAADLASARAELGDVGAYRFDQDTTGRPISPIERRTYLSAMRNHPDAALPTPFLPEDAAAYRSWRRSVWRPRVTATLKGFISPSAHELLISDRRFQRLRNALSRSQPATTSGD